MCRDGVNEYQTVLVTPFAQKGSGGSSTATVALVVSTKSENGSSEITVATLITSTCTSEGGENGGLAPRRVAGVERTQRHPSPPPRHRRHQVRPVRGPFESERLSLPTVGDRYVAMRGEEGPERRPREQVPLGRVRREALIARGDDLDRSLLITPDGQRTPHDEVVRAAVRRDEIGVHVEPEGRLQLEVGR